MLNRPRQPIPPRRRSPHYILWLLLLTFAALPNHATAQPASPPPIRLAQDPVPLDRAGVILRVPEDTVIQTRTLAARQVTTLTMPAGLGVIVVQPREISDTQNTPASSPEADAARLVADILQLDPTRSFNPARDRPATNAGRFNGPGPIVTTRLGSVRPLYATLRPRENALPVVRGIAVLAANPERRVVFDLITSTANEDRARPAFEAVLASVVAREADIADRARETRRRAAGAMLANITEDQLKAILADDAPRFERLYRPGPDGTDASAEELGYRRTTARLGTSRDVTASGPEEPGYVVTVEARLLGEAGQRIDSQALYFLSESRRDETWSVNMTVRSEGPPTTWTETGARSGRDLTVSIARGRSGHRTVRPKILVEGYLSRVESLLLPRLLAFTADTRPLAFTSFDSGTESVVERTETLSRTERGWQLRTEYQDGRTQTADLTPAGNNIKTELDSGLIWETTDFDRLYRLWLSKGLPLN